MKKTFLTLLILQLTTFLFAMNSKQVVKVGCQNLPQFIEQKKDGSFFGYATEYLDEICKYTNWQIEYVVAPLKSQLAMLENEQIDIIPFGQYSVERAKQFAFSRQPMDTVQGLLCTREDNNDIFYNEYSAFNGKTVAIVKGDFNISFLRRFADLHNFTLKVKTYDYHEQTVQALLDGEVDLLATEQVILKDGLRIVAHFGSDPSYFMLNKNNRQLLDKLNFAMNEIYAKDGTYRSRLYNKYYGFSYMHAKPIFTREEFSFIKKGKTLSVILNPDTQPESYLDKNGNIVGIIPDILNLISEFSGLKFECHFGQTNEHPIEHLKKVPSDLVAGALAIDPSLKKSGLLMSDTFYTSYCALLTNSTNTKKIDFDNSEYELGIPETFIMLEPYITEKYPNLHINKEHKTIMQNLNALRNGKIDLFCYDLNSVLHFWGNPRYTKTRIISTSFLQEPQCIVTLPIHENKIAIRIINKCISSIPKEKIEEIERYHTSQNYYRPTLQDTIFRLRHIIVFTLLFIITIYIFLTYIITKSKANQNVIAKKNDELTLALQMADTANRAKSNFLSKMSHDIRTPMNAIMGMTELSLKEDIQNKKVVEYLQKIDLSSNLLLKLLNDILDSTALESGKIKIASTPFNLLTELQTILNLYITQCKTKNINFIYDFSDLKNPELLGDSLRLSQVIMNILSNAYKFTESTGKIIFTATEEQITKDKTEITFTIQDTGCGMDSKMLNRIWLAFEQNDATTAHKYGGSGLGMNIAKNLTTLMNGNIFVKSQLNVGTKFIVRIPFKINTDKKSILKAKEKQNKQINFAGVNILVADDDEFNREVVQGLLESVNANVVCVEDGQEAYDKFTLSQEKTFDIILLDVHMPKLDGYQTCKKIRESSHSEGKIIPILALTADTYPEDLQKAKAAGMNGHLAKPIYAKDLYNKINELLLYKNEGGG